MTTEKKTGGGFNFHSVPTGGPRHGKHPRYCFPPEQARPAMAMSSLFLLGEMDGWRILYRQPHRGETGECTDLRNAASCLRFISDRRKESGKIYILNGVPPEGRMSRCGMDRRQFLKCLGTTAGTAVAWGTGLMAGGGNLLSGGFGSLLREAAAAEHSAQVAVASGASAAENVRRAVDALGGIKMFLSRGDVVVLKPNIGWDRTPEQAANTDPDVVVALAELCLSAGAKEVRVFDRTCNEPRRCYVNSGIQRAIETYARKHHAGDSLRVYHVEDRKFQRTDIAGALVLREWDLYRDALEADKIINAPVAKHHSLATVTLGLKNMMGVMGGNRGQIHFRLPECLVDLNRRVPTRLTVIDATRIRVTEL